MVNIFSALAIKWIDKTQINKLNRKKYTSYAAFTRKLIEDGLHQNKGVCKDEKGMCHGLTGELIQERNDGDSQDDDRGPQGDICAHM